LNRLLERHQANIAVRTAETEQNNADVIKAATQAAFDVFALALLG
jgi:hypothetical protein